MLARVSRVRIPLSPFCWNVIAKASNFFGCFFCISFFPIDMMIAILNILFTISLFTNGLDDVQ